MVYGTKIILLTDWCANCICLHWTVSTALPTASVKIVTTQETLYSGDTVKLQCELSDYTDWTYHWLINKEGPSRQTSKTTTIYLSDQAGQYHCEGTRTRRTQNSYLSSSLHINITGELNIYLQSLLDFLYSEPLRVILITDILYTM